jgi:hypothetical protein
MSRQRAVAVASLFVLLGTGSVFLIMVELATAPGRFYYWLFGGLYIGLCAFLGRAILRVGLQACTAGPEASRGASLEGMAFHCASLGIGAGVAAMVPGWSWLFWLTLAVVIGNAAGLWIVRSWVVESPVAWALTVDRLSVVRTLFRRGSPIVAEPEGCLLGILLFMLVGGFLVSAWLVGDVILPLLARALWSLPRRLLHQASSVASRAIAVAVWTGITLAWLIGVYTLVSHVRAAF